MKHKYLFILALMMMYVVPSIGQTAAVTLRPSHIDISSAEAQSAVLITLSEYPEEEVRYRLFRGSNQYFPWNPATGEYISTTSYVTGPLAPGNPSESTTFWIMFRRGSNNSTLASYRDRLGPEFTANYQTAELPGATEITDAFFVTHDLVNFSHEEYAAKLVVLGYDQEEGGTLITAASTDLETGNFSLTGPVGVQLKRIELRTASNELLETKTGLWPEVQQVVTPMFDPDPGIYRDMATVTITTTTDGAEIRFTLNGEEPDETSDLYTEPLEITASATLKARAFKEGYTDSETETGDYRIIGEEHWETFDGMEHTGTAYRTGSFEGQDGSTWEYEMCAGSIRITGQSITLGRNQNPQSNVQSGVISGGVGTIDFNYLQAFSTDVNLGVYVNDQLVGTVTSTSEQNIVKHSGPVEVNIPGDVVIKFMNIENSAGQVVIDNVIWSGYESPTSVADLPGSGVSKDQNAQQAFARIFMRQSVLVVEFLDEVPSSGKLLELFDLGGRRLMARELGDSRRYEHSLDLIPGLYLVRISDATSAQTNRVFLQ